MELTQLAQRPKHAEVQLDNKVEWTLRPENEALRDGDTGICCLADRDEREGSGHSTIWLGFVPWLVFAVISHRDTPEAAVVVGLVVAVLVAIPGVAAGRPKILELGTIAFFLAFGVIVFAVDPGSNDFLSRYARAIATGGLALIAFSSLALGSPFTEQYAREQVDSSKWDSPLFRTLNRRFTAIWGAVFVAMACSHVIAGAIDTRRAETIFNWVIPIAWSSWS